MPGVPGIVHNSSNSLGLSSDSGFSDASSPFDIGLPVAACDLTSRLSGTSSPWSPSADTPPTVATGVGAAVGSGASGVMTSPSISWEDETEDLAELFGRLGLGKYTDLFEQQEVEFNFVLDCYFKVNFCRSTKR